MHVQVHSLKKTLFEGSAKSLNCNTLAGEVTILPHHRPLLTVLDEGVMKIVTHDSQGKFVNIKNGFMEVANSGVRCIIEEA